MQSGEGLRACAHVPLTPGEGWRKLYCPSVGCFWTEMRLVPTPGPQRRALRAKGAGARTLGPSPLEEVGGAKGEETQRWQW